MMLTDFVLDYLEDAGVMLDSPAEHQALVEGVRLFLRENGVPEEDERVYFQKYLLRVLPRIHPLDQKAFFLHYAAISRVQQLCLTFSANGSLPDAQLAELRQDMAERYAADLGDRYVPTDAVRQLLGRFM